MVHKRVKGFSSCLTSHPPGELAPVYSPISKKKKHSILGPPDVGDEGLCSNMPRCMQTVTRVAAFTSPLDLAKSQALRLTHDAGRRQQRPNLGLAGLPIALPNPGPA